MSTALDALWGIALTTCFLSAANVDTCKILARAVGAANVFIMPCVSGLFFVRLHAVYAGQTKCIAFFAACWFLVLGFFIYDSWQILSRFSNVGASAQCFVVKHSDAWGYMANAVYDTLMYLAISWRLAMYPSQAEGWKDRVNTFFTGAGLRGLTKALLRSGQMYYL